MNTTSIIGVLSQYHVLIGGGDSSPVGPNNQTIIDMFGETDIGFALDFTEFDGAFTSADGAFGTLPWETPIADFGTPPSTFRHVDLLGNEFTSDNDPDDNASQVSQFEQDTNSVTRFRTAVHGLVMPELVSTTQNYTFGITLERFGTSQYFFDSPSGRLIFAIDSGNGWAYFDGSWRGSGIGLPDEPVSAIYELDATAGEGRIYINGVLSATLSYTPRNIGGATNRLWSRNGGATTNALDAGVYRQFLIDRLLTADERADLDYWLRSVINSELLPPGDESGGSLIGEPATGDEVAARYWRIFGIAGSGNIQYTEVELRSAVDGTDDSSSGTPIASSSYLNNAGSYGPQLAFDDDNGTRWAANGSTDQWIGIDFGAGNSMVLRQVRLLPVSGFTSQSWTKASVQYSDDGDTWTDYAFLTDHPNGILLSQEDQTFTVTPNQYFETGTVYASPAGSFSEAQVQSPTGVTLMRTPDPIIRGVYASARKVLIARAVWNNKSDVWDTETVDFLDSDKTGISSMWHSPLATGDTPTWKQLVEFMLIPSYSDVAETIQRVLGGELNAQDSLAADADSRFKIEVDEVIADLGLEATTFYNANPSKANPTAEAPLYDAVKWPLACTEVPELLAILQSPSATINITGSNPRAVTINNTSMFVNGIGANQLGDYWTGHVGGKTGTHQTTNLAHLFLHEMPNGDVLRFGLVEADSTLLRFHDAARLIFEIADDIPSYAPTGTDSDLANVDLILGQTATSTATAYPSRTVTSTAAPAVVQNTGKLYEYEFNFNGSEYLDLGDLTEWNLGNQDFTMEMWIRGKGTYPGTSQNLFNKYYPSDGDRGYQFRITTGPESLQFWYSFNGVDAGNVIKNFGVNYLMNGALTHLCAQRSGSDLTVYVNGERGPIANVGNNSFHTTGHPLLIGARGRATAEDEYASLFMQEARLTVGTTRYAFDGFPVPIGKFPRT